MKKPLEMTPEGFAKLLEAAIVEKQPSSQFGLQSGAGQMANVSADAISEMLRQRFPKKLGAQATSVHRRKVIRGAVFSLTRVCDTFELDLDACLQALGLPRDERTIVASRHTRVINVLTADDIEMLLNQVKILGPMPVKLAQQLVAQYRKNPKK